MPIEDTEMTQANSLMRKKYLQEGCSSFKVRKRTTVVRCCQFPGVGKNKDQCKNVISVRVPDIL